MSNNNCGEKIYINTIDNNIIIYKQYTPFGGEGPLTK